MKKLLSLLLTVILVASALPMTVGAAGELTNVALNRPGFASFYYAPSSLREVHWPDLATDGNPETDFAVSGTTFWYYVDLGAAYTIDNIKLLIGQTENHRTGYEVYLSNSRQDATTAVSAEDKVLVYTADADNADNEGYVNIDVANHATLTTEQKEAAYQFVYVEKNSAVTDGCTVKELEVYTADTVTDPSYLVEIGAHKPTFVATHMDTAGAARQNANWMANDRNPNTRYATRGVASGQVQRFVMDLEAAYPLRAIVYRASTNTNELTGYTFYGSNDPTFLTKTELLTESRDTTLGPNFYAIPDTITDSFRYLVIEHASNLAISDIQVYTDNLSATPNYAYNQGSETHLISNFSPVAGGTVNQSAANPVKNINDSWLSYKWSESATDRELNFILDLGAPQEIDYVTLNTATTDKNYLNYGMKLVATNDPDFAAENDAVIYDAGTQSMVGDQIETVTLPLASFFLYEAPASMEGQKYRYVGMRVPLVTPYSYGAGARGEVAELAVYTKAENMTEVYNDITFAKSTTADTDFTVSANKFLSVTRRPVKFIAAAYDAEDNLVEVRTGEVAVYAGEPVFSYKKDGIQGALSGTVSFADSQNLAKIKKVKTMLWDSMSAIRPIVAGETFAIDAFYTRLTTPETTTTERVNYVASADASTGTYTWRAGGYHETYAGLAASYPSSYFDDCLTDSNLSTAGGWGPKTANGFIYVDLGSAKTINRVTAVSYDNINSGERAKGQEFYLTNINPYDSAVTTADGSQAFYEQFTTDKKTSDIYYLGTQENQPASATAAGANLTFDIPDNEVGTYRYLVVKVKVGISGTAGNGAGGTIAELHAYQKQ